MTFRRISAKTHELLAFILCCWRPYCSVGVHIMLLASILCNWRPCCCWLVLTISGILVVAGLPSAVDAVMFLLSPAAVGLPPCCCRLHCFCKHPCFWWHPCYIGGPVVAFTLLLLAFLLLWAVLILLSLDCRMRHIKPLDYRAMAIKL